LVKPKRNSIANFDLALREHSESTWVTPDILVDVDQYDSLMPALRDMLLKAGD
jgi:hypothetical protein